MVDYVYHSIPFYRRQFEKNDIHPSEIRSLRDLQYVPRLDRSMADVLSREVYAKSNKSFVSLRSSGTSGIPLTTYLSRRDIHLRRMSYVRMHIRAGREASDRMLVIVPPHTHCNTRQFHFCERYQKTEFYLDSGLPDKDIICHIQRLDPDIILGYSSRLLSLAAALRKKGEKVNKARLVFTTADCLLPSERKDIEAAFNAAVFDYYSCSEGGIVGYECRMHKGYHIDTDNIIVEIIKNGRPVRPGETGEVHISTVSQYAMPFIRYKVGDVASFAGKKCECGDTFPLLTLVEGRINDSVVLPNGKRISPYRLMLALDTFTDIKRYKIIQQTDMTIFVFLDVYPANSSLYRTAEKRIKKTVGETVSVLMHPYEKAHSSNRIKKQTVTSYVTDCVKQ